MISSIKKFFSNLSAKSEDRPGWSEREIKLDETGFIAVEADSSDEPRCDWSRVCEVFACKIDLFSYDEICLGFRFNPEGNYWWVGESYTGCQLLLDELPRRFPGIRTDWFSEVSVPAFVENRTTLWRETLPPVERPKLPKRRWLFW